MSILEGHILEKEAEYKKKGKKNTWVQNMIENIGKCKLVTHVGKFTHPESKITARIERGTNLLSEYVTTDSVICREDIFYSSAAYMSAARFLDLELEDGRTVLEHIEGGDNEIKILMEKYGGKYDDFLDALDMAKSSPKMERTEYLLKQVYFPIDNGEYHLLTILPNSSVLCEMTQRVKKMSQERDALKKSEKEIESGRYKELIGRTVIGFGGTKAQNISELNFSHTGRHVLLESLPPVLDRKTVQYPTRDFWRNTMKYYYVSYLVSELQNLYRKENNLAVRNARENIVQNIIERVFQVKYQLWHENPDWISQEKYRDSPNDQVAWLDLEQRIKLTDEILEKLSQDFSRWLIKVYEKTLKRENVALGKEEFVYFSECMKQAIKKEVIW